MNLVFLAAFIAACQAAKLDRTYLPPPSSQFAGGPPGSLQAPFITGSNRNRPGFFINPFVRTSDSNPSQGNLPSGGYENENEGVVVDAAAAGTRASNQPSGLGGPRVNYGSTDSKVGDAAFRGTKNQAGPNTNGKFQTQTQIGSAQGQGSFGLNNNNQEYSDLSAFQQSAGQVNAGFRPGNQLFRDRVSNTIKYHNEIGLKKFNYGFETENGIKMEQNGVSNDGIHTQGGYSYTGDDGKVYSVVYTADKDGYRPMGAHLPTPPPIPEEILEALHQNARDEANGLYDDGSYDAQKYNAEDDYTQSDTNGNHNDRQSNKFEKRPGFNAGASINQQQQGFVRPNVQGQFGYDFSNTDTTKFGAGGIGVDKTQSEFNAQLNNKFGSQFQHLPPLGNTQESKPLQEKDSYANVGNVRPLTEQKFQDNGAFGNIVAPNPYGISGHSGQGLNNQQHSSQSFNSFGASNNPQNEGAFLHTLMHSNSSLSLPTPIVNIGITSSQENQNNKHQSQILPFQTNLQSSDKNKMNKKEPNRLTSQLPTLSQIAPSLAPAKDYETEKNTFNVNSITQASISPFPPITSTLMSQTQSGEVYDYPKPGQGLPAASQEDNQESSFPTTSQDYTIKPQINEQFNTQFGQKFPSTSTLLSGQGSSPFGQNPTTTPLDSLSFDKKTTPSSLDSQTSTSANKETSSSFEKQQTQTSFGFGQQTTPTHFGGHSSIDLEQESSKAQGGQTSLSFGSQTTPSRFGTQGSISFGQQTTSFNAFKKPCSVCSTFGQKTTRPQPGTQNSFSNSKKTHAEQIPTSSFGISPNEQTTLTRFGLQTTSSGQKTTQPQTGTQTTYSFGSQTTPSRFGVLTGSSFDQKITPSTFGTSSFTGQQTTPTFSVQTDSTLGQQTTPTFGVETSSTFGQKPTPAIGVQTGSTLEKQTTPTFGAQTSSKFGQTPTQTFDVQTGFTLGQQTTPTFGVETSSTFEQKPTQTFGVQTGSTLGQQTTPTFGVETSSTFGRKPTQTFGVQTGSTLKQQTTPTFGVETSSTFGTKPTQTFGVQTGSTLKQQTTPTFGVETSSTFGQKPTQTFGVQTGSRLGQQTTPTFGVETSSTFGQKPTQTFGVQTGSTLGHQTIPNFGVETSSTFGQKPTQTFGLQTGSTLGQQTTPTFVVETSSTFGQKPTQTFGVQTGSTLGQQTTPTFGVETSSTSGHTITTQSDDASSEGQSTMQFGVDFNKQINKNFAKPEQSQSQESNELSESKYDSKLSTLHSTISDSQSSEESIETTNSYEIYQYNKPSTAFPSNTQISTLGSEQSQGTQYNGKQPVTQSDAQSFSTPSRKEYPSQPNQQSQEEIFPTFPEQQKVTNSPFAAQQTTQFVASTNSLDQGFDTKETTQFSSTSQSESAQYQPSTDPAFNSEIQPTQSQQSGELYHYNKPLADSSIENNVSGQKITQAQFTAQPLQNKLDVTIPIAAHLSQTNENDNGQLTTKIPFDYTQTGSTPSMKPVNSRPQFSFYSACCQGDKTQNNNKDTESSSGKIQSNNLNVMANFEGISNENGLKDKFGNQDSGSTGSSGLGIQRDTPNFGSKGEEFGGPRKPPTFDDTGYHY